VAAAVLAVAAVDAAAACRATPVRGAYVHAGPVAGAITRPWDVLDGRFRLRPGRWRDRETGLTQKIAWFVPRRADPGPRLTIVGRRLDRRGRFVQRLERAGGTGEPNREVYPSIVSPPRAGCWRLRFHSGKARGRLTVIVKP
jgi:hypothetical protein